MAESNVDRVLVVEDQGVSRMLLCHYLEGGGYETTSASSYLEALKLIEEFPFRVVILEMMLNNQELSGREFIDEIRNRHNLAELPIIVITSLEEESERLNAWRAGVNYYIKKPCGESETLAKVKLCVELNRAYRGLQGREERLSLAMSSINGGVFDWNIKNNTFSASPRFYELLDIEDKETQPRIQNWLDAIHPEDYAANYEELNAYLAGQIPQLELQHRVMHQDGTHRWVLVRGLALRNDKGQAERLIGNISDISSSLSYDNATGLPGRHIFYDILERSMVRSIRNSKFLFALLNVTIEDTAAWAQEYSEAEQAKIWATISRRLQLSSRASDLISRVELNRFALLLDDIREVSDALRVAERVGKSLAAPLRLGERQIALRTSIGVAVSCDEYESPESLLRDAYRAAQEASQLGPNLALMSNEKHQKVAQARLTMEQELYDAVAGKQFHPRFLPLVDAQARQIVGLEVLLRWRHPHGQLLLPQDFLDLCDREQLILPIGYELFKLALEKVERATKISPLPMNFTINFNLSLRQFQDPELLDNILLSCQDLAFDPARIRLEVDEEVLAADITQSQTILERLAQAKVGVVVDRFGSGSLPLDELLDLPLAGLKTECLARCRDRGWSAQKLRRYSVATLGIAKYLGYPCFASGVDTEELSKSLLEKDLIYQEGFHFGEPLTVNGLEIMAENGYRLE